MTQKKYKRGRQICSMGDFEQSESKYFIIYFGSTCPRTRHRGFLISWQYRVLKNFIDRGHVWEAVKREECE